MSLSTDSFLPRAIRWAPAGAMCWANTVLEPQQGTEGDKAALVEQQGSQPGTWEHSEENAWGNMTSCKAIQDIV